MSESLSGEGGWGGEERGGIDFTISLANMKYYKLINVLYFHETRNPLYKFRQIYLICSGNIAI